MKKFIFLTASVMAFTATPALAESSDVITVNMTGNVQQICTAKPSANFSGSNFNGGSGSYSASDDTVNIVFDFGIANTNDPSLASVGQTGQAFFSVNFDTFCNDDFTVTTQPSNGSFDNANSAPTGFVNTLPYAYSFKKGSSGLNTGNASTAARVANSVAYDGNMSIDFNVKPSTIAAVAGDYKETMTVTFAADA